MHGIHKTEEGFTLLELLIAMIIGAGLVYLTSEVFSLIQRGVEQSRQVADQVMTEQRAITVVREALSNLIPPVISDKRYRIVATESIFEFVTVPVDSRSQWGSMNTRIIVEPSAGGKFMFVFEQWQSGAGALLTIPKSRLILFKDLKSASLQYLYLTSRGLHTEPAEPEQHPELVTLRWTRADSVGQTGAESLSVRTRIDAGANCQLDLQSLSCR
ncbi:general secretion pathway protein J [Nitrosomonas eutropha]|uniref:PulJ/GspJ family protein n=1 Tax=Nitrosomonas TaxID=914 RepID=UPI00088C4A37|nr:MULTISPECIES: type II secretion system protein [Nitrosomonas]MXS80728.1 type II secretion system protein [Nitrosomonas sp. GH22]SCX16356.1 general secretion pathway protein J [Nitrosomonas eutropha]